MDMGHAYGGNIDSEGSSSGVFNLGFISLQVESTPKLWSIGFPVALPTEVGLRLEASGAIDWDAGEDLVELS